MINNNETTDKKSIVKKIVLFIFAIIFLLLVCTSSYFFYQYQMIKKQLVNNPSIAQEVAAEKTNKLISEISQFMELPKDEMPTLAFVTDFKKLKSQPFFQHAKDGDALLIFTKERLAILYDPNTHKLVNVGPVTVGNQQNQPAQAKIVLRNGTDTPGLTVKAERQLKKAFPGIAIEKKEQASSAYNKTVVVAFNASAKNAAESLAKFYNVSLSNLPKKEKKPEGMDILIVLGKDEISKVTATASANQ